MLPTNVGTGLVVGQFGLGVSDGSDIDREPELIPVSGRIIFTPSVTYLPNVTADPNPVTIISGPIVAVLDADGYVCTPGPDGVSPMYRGIRLFATNDPDMSVENWTWSVVYQFDPINGFAPKLPAHAMALLEGEEIDLTKVVPVPSSPGIGTPQALALLAAAEAAAQSVRDDANAGLFNGEAATLQIGSVASGPTAKVVNVGDEQNAIFDITLEKGDKGDPGTGIPDTGEALQVMRMDSSGTSAEWVTPTKTVVGLSNVDNTSDMNKPVSTMQKLALDEKLDAAKLPDEVDGVNKNLIEDPASLTAGALSAAIGEGVIEGSSGPTFRTAFAGRTRDGIKSPRPNQVITNFQPGHGFTVLGTSLSSASDDTTDYAIGTQSLAVVTKTGGLAGSVQATVAAVDATGDVLMLTAKVDDTTNLNQIVLYAASDAGYANHYAWTIQDAGTESQKFFKSGEYATITLSFADAAISGTPNRAALTNFRVRAGTNTGFSTSVRYNRLATAKEATGAVISIAIDDIYRSTWTHLRKATDKKGYPVTVYAIPERATSEYVTLAQLHTLEDVSGWEIAGHGLTGFNGMALEDMEADAVRSKRWLQENGFKGVDHYAYVGGQFNPDVEKVMKKYYRAARSIISRTTSETLPPANAYRLRSTSVANTTAVSLVKDAITRAVANNGWYILTLHDIVDGASGTAPLPVQYTMTDLEDILNHIASLGVPVRTIGDVLASLDAEPEKKTVAAPDLAATVNRAMGNSPVRMHAVPRHMAGNTAGGVVAGDLNLTCFTPVVDIAIGALIARTGTVAWAGATLTRLGLYTADETTGEITLVAETASDTAIFSAPSTTYRVPLSAVGGLPTTYTLKAGQRYAVGALGVGITAGTLIMGNMDSALAARGPRACGKVSGLTDLPATGTIVETGNFIWVELGP